MASVRARPIRSAHGRTARSSGSPRWRPYVSLPITSMRRHRWRPFESLTSPWSVSPLTARSAPVPPAFPAPPLALRPTKPSARALRAACPLAMGPSRTCRLFRSCRARGRIPILARPTRHRRPARPAPWPRHRRRCQRLYHPPRIELQVAARVRRGGRARTPPAIETRLPSDAFNVVRAAQEPDDERLPSLSVSELRAGQRTAPAMLTVAFARWAFHRKHARTLE